MGAIVKRRFVIVAIVLSALITLRMLKSAEVAMVLVFFFARAFAASVSANSLMLKPGAGYTRPLALRELNPAACCSSGLPRGGPFAFCLFDPNPNLDAFAKLSSLVLAVLPPPSGRAIVDASPLGHAIANGLQRAAQVVVVEAAPVTHKRRDDELTFRFWQLGAAAA